jgi:cytochrome P450
VKEIRSTLKTDAEIRSGPELSGCHYLRACIDEALRIAPPIPGTLWRELEPTDDRPLVVDGQVIPRGTQVGVNTYSIHHNEEYFQDPYAFNPERWLSSETPEKQLNVMRAAFYTFLYRLPLMLRKTLSLSRK